MLPRHSRVSCTALLCIMLLGIAGCSSEKNRLQMLVTSCLDVSGETYCNSCQSPRTESGCVADNACTRTTEVWRENMYYVAIRDRKMCGCSDPGFIHGLAIPRAIISGVDAPNRPNGLWSFAWQTALERNIRRSDIALAINPKHDRSENQMHIHITRLRDDARSRITPEMSARVNDLASVWSVAGKIAAAKGLSDYGVLVTAGKDGDFMVVVDEDSPEDRFMAARCSKR
ncbi:MAG TPA: CDP-diacylglycerol diphosphatase [Geobacteraceae bacterium]|nr:CDP-diacylglycerol diphosphatase [Geobacteraceae bacterium]